jgi:hypothetical protein
MDDSKVQKVADQTLVSDSCSNESRLNTIIEEEVKDSSIIPNDSPLRLSNNDLYLHKRLDNYQEDDSCYLEEE